MTQNVIVPPFTTAPETVVGGAPQSVFPFEFPFWESADILVYSDGVLVPDSGYTVAGLAIQSSEAVEGGYGSGTVTLDVAVSNVTITIDRLVVGDRDTQFSRSVPLAMPALNGDLNRLTARQQDLKRLVGTNRAYLDAAIAEAGDSLAMIDKVSLAALAASTGAALVGWVSSTTGAILRTIHDRLNDVVSVKDFGATGNGTTDDSAALNLALASGKSLRFPAGTYNANLLTSSAGSQALYGDGEIIIAKNGNGALLTHTGTRPTIRGIAFKGDGFTGDGLVLTGTAATLINCGSQNMAGRAVKATGNRFTLRGTSSLAVYNTTDATGSGYDLEIGVSGTATLYHRVDNLQTSQATGGILFIDTGSAVVSGGQFGKLSITSGTSPAGVNGGVTMGARILGDITINLSNAMLSGNQISSVVVTAGTGTAGIIIDRSNTWATGSSYVNNGNNANYVARDGAQSGLISTKYGPDASLAIEAFDPSTGDFYNVNGHTRYANNRGVVLNAGNGNIVMSGGNLGVNNNIGSTQLSAAGALQFLPVGESVFYTNGVRKFAINSAGRPQFDGGTQTTVGAAGGGSALPATPTGYIIVNVGGTEFVMPYFAKA